MARVSVFVTGFTLLHLVLFSVVANYQNIQGSGSSAI